MERTSLAQRWALHSTPGRGGEVAVALLYAFVGVLVAVNFEPLRFFGYRWYQSWWFPLASASLLFATVAIWLRLSWLKASLFGLLVTVPPYCRWLLLVVETYLNPGAENSVTAFKDYAGAMALTCVFTLSGGFLNPLISGMVGRFLRR